MNRFPKIFIVAIMIFLLHAGSGYTDTVLLRNGDQLNGNIQNEYLVVRTSYSQIVVTRAFCKNLAMNADQRVTGSLQTINNDVLTGTILNSQIQILLADNSRETVNINDLNSLYFEYSGPSRQVPTSIFTMHNDDRLSGKLLDTQVKVRTNYMTGSYKGSEINRIEFAADAPDKVKLLLVNGDIIQGNLLLDHFYPK